MRLPGGDNREYRVLAIATLFFLTGLLFFWLDRPPASSPSAPPATTSHTLSVQSSQSEGEQDQQYLDPDFAKFPPPTQFKTVTYNANGLNGSSTLLASATCNAAYITVLLFPAKIDYRGDINAAVYNEASPCHSDQPFTLVIATSDIATAPFGSYYLIIADQGTSGTWYNPR